MKNKYDISYRHDKRYEGPYDLSFIKYYIANILPDGLSESFSHKGNLKSVQLPAKGFSLKITGRCGSEVECVVKTPRQNNLHYRIKVTNYNPKST